MSDSIERTFEPIAVIQESAAGINPAPEVLAACWGAQVIGLLFPAVSIGGVVPVAARVEMVLAPLGAVYYISQAVAICAPQPGDALPSAWPVVDVYTVNGAYTAGEVVGLSVPVNGTMATEGWGVQLRAAGTAYNNLRGVVGSVRLVVAYAVPEPPEAEPQEYVYTIHRPFVPGDSVALNVMNGGRLVAEMRFVIQ
jgi:hypothetical protein